MCKTSCVVVPKWGEMLGNVWVMWVILGIEIASLRLVAFFTGDALTFAANAEFIY